MYDSMRLRSFCKLSWEVKYLVFHKFALLFQNVKTHSLLCYSLTTLPQATPSLTTRGFQSPTLKPEGTLGLHFLNPPWETANLHLPLLSRLWAALGLSKVFLVILCVGFMPMTSTKLTAPWSRNEILHGGGGAAYIIQWWVGVIMSYSSWKVKNHLEMFTESAHLGHGFRSTWHNYITRFKGSKENCGKSKELTRLVPMPMLFGGRGKKKKTLVSTTFTFPYIPWTQHIIHAWLCCVTSFWAHCNYNIIIGGRLGYVPWKRMWYWSHNILTQAYGIKPCM